MPTVFINLLYLLLFIVFIFVSIAYFTLLERKVMGAIQRRSGPDSVGILGLLQPFADALKLFTKTMIIPKIANKFIFLFAPMFTLFLSLLSWSFLPLNPYGAFCTLDLSLLFIFMLSSLGIYGIFLSGWSSNNKYAFLGSMRCIAQMISYEICFSIIIVPIVFCSGSANLTSIILVQQNCWNIFGLLPLSVLFFICLLAETNRAPFDLPEAEAELVAGYNVEYSSLSFAYFFLGEYANIMTISLLFVLLFLGGDFLLFFDAAVIMPGVILSFKLFLVIFLIIWVRATLPRIRYDNLMLFCWKYCLPLSLALSLFYIVLLCICLTFFGDIPPRDIFILYWY